MSDVLLGYICGLVMGVAMTLFVVRPWDKNEKEKEQDEQTDKVD